MRVKLTGRSRDGVQWFMTVFAASVLVMMTVIAGVQAQQTPENLVTVGEKPFRLGISPEKEGIDVLWIGNEEPVKLGSINLHIYPDGWQPQLAMQKELVDTEMTDGGFKATYSMSGKYGGDSTLNVSCQPGKTGFNLVLTADVPEEVIDRMGNKTRIM
ncbi:MAG: hypothetical protein ACOC0A_02830, partial [Planctomycetota bacterium]